MSHTACIAEAMNAARDRVARAAEQNSVTSRHIGGEWTTQQWESHTKETREAQDEAALRVLEDLELECTRKRRRLERERGKR